MKLLAVFLFVAALGLAADSGRFYSYYSKSDFPLTADPSAPQWKNIEPIIAERGLDGELVPGHRTEIRSRWTDKNLYLLYVCPYEELHVKPNPTQTEETDQLWDYDVAEFFVGTDFKDIRRYKEFQVSPQGEWVDLDINRNEPSSHSAKWNSGYKVKGRIDKERKIWYGEMQIPFASFDPRPPKKGNEMRANCYRLQGPPERQVHVTWLPTHAKTYHTPEAFGTLVLR